jgi:hypothetical protein
MLAYSASKIRKRAADGRREPYVDVREESGGAPREALELLRPGQVFPSADSCSALEEHAPLAEAAAGPEAERPAP